MIFLKGSSAGNAIEKTELSGNLKNDVASMLRNVRAADPKKNNAGNFDNSSDKKKLKKEREKKKSVQKKGKGKAKVCLTRIKRIMTKYVIHCVQIWNAEKQRHGNQLLAQGMSCVMACIC